MGHGGWQDQERQPNGEFGPSLEVAEAPAGSAAGFDEHGLATEANVRDLATLIETEAGGQPADTKTTIGAVVVNRMRRNDTSRVQDVWGGFAHFKEPSRESRIVARELLEAPGTDPTQGATHFYTPQAMPKEGNHSGGRGQTLESVPGVVDKSDAPVRNYRPHYADIFPEQHVPGIPERSFKFYRDPGNGPTH